MSAKIFFASVLTSILILAPVTYFVLPVLYPNMKQGVVIQSTYVNFDTEAYIYDDELTYKMMDETTYTITTQGDSSLIVLFTADGIMTLDTVFTQKSAYHIALVISGEGNRTIYVDWFEGTTPAAGTIRQLTYDITINFATGSLIAGDYTISVYWKSNFDATGTYNSLSVNHNNSYEYDRSFWIQEVSA